MSSATKQPKKMKIENKEHQIVNSKGSGILAVKHQK